MKPSIFLFTLIATFNAILHADPPASISGADVVLRGNPPKLTEVDHVEDANGHRIYSIDRAKDRAGTIVNYADGKPADTTNYKVILSDGSTLSANEAWKLVGTQDSSFARGAKEYLAVTEMSDDRSAKSRVAVEKVENTVHASNGNIFYRALGDKGYHWVSWDEVKGHASFIPEDQKLADFINKKVPKSSRVVLSNESAAQLTRESNNGLGELADIVDALSKRQASLPDLKQIRDVTLDPKAFGSDAVASRIANIIRTHIDQTISGAVKDAAPVASDVHAADVAKEIKADTIR